MNKCKFYAKCRECKEVLRGSWLYVIVLGILILSFVYMMFVANRSHLLTERERDILYGEKGSLDNIVLNLNGGSLDTADSIMEKLLGRRPDITKISVLSGAEVEENENCKNWKYFTSKCGHIDGSSFLYPERYAGYGLKRYLRVDVSGAMRKDMMHIDQSLFGVSLMGCFLALFLFGKFVVVSANKIKVERKKNGSHVLFNYGCLLAGLKKAPWMMEPVEKVFSREFRDRHGAEGIKKQMSAVQNAIGGFYSYEQDRMAYLADEKAEDLNFLSLFDSYANILDGYLWKSVSGIKFSSSHGNITGDVIVRMRPSYFRVILMNLFLNSIYACKNVDDAAIGIRAELIREKKEVNIYFNDNGVGFDSSLVSMVFQDGFTTKGANGSGQGLYAVKKYLHEIGGRVEVRSNVGVGTSFTLTFPVKFQNKA